MSRPKYTIFPFFDAKGESAIPDTKPMRICGFCTASPHQSNRAQKIKIANEVISKVMADRFEKDL